MIYHSVSADLSENWTLETEDPITIVGDDVYQRTVVDEPDPDFPESVQCERVSKIGTTAILLDPVDYLTIDQRGYLHIGPFGSASGRLISYDDVEAWILDVRGGGDASITVFLPEDAHQIRRLLDAGEMFDFRQF